MSRIERRRTIRLAERPSLIRVEVTTDEGLTGLGESFRGAEVTEAVIHESIAVPDRGGAPALAALVTQEADMTPQGATQSMPFVVNNRMRGIAVAGPRRFPNLPNLPTFRALGWPQADSGTWQGILVQGQTPTAVIARLEREIAAVLAEAAIRTRAGGLGGELAAEGAAAFRQRLSEQTAACSQMIRANNLRIA